MKIKYENALFKTEGELAQLVTRWKQKVRKTEVLWFRIPGGDGLFVGLFEVCGLFGLGHGSERDWPNSLPVLHTLFLH